MTMRRRPLLRLLVCFGLAIVYLGSVGSAAERRCTCRYAGQSYPVGTCVCMVRPGGVQQRTCCGMVLNNTSWEFTGKACPSAMSEPAAPPQMRLLSEQDFDVAPKIAFARHSAVMRR